MHKIKRPLERHPYSKPSIIDYNSKSPFHSRTGNTVAGAVVGALVGAVAAAVLTKGYV